MSITENVYNDAVELLEKLISIPSLSGEENNTADLLYKWLLERGVNAQRDKNNVYAFNNNAPENTPLILLNSHHDTVRPVDGWTQDPYRPTKLNGKLFGLGSNDAGASVVSLCAVFLYLSQQPQLPYRLCLAITAEEEISGNNGIQALLPMLGDVSLGIVGEPTSLRLAIAEKGLMVVDVVVKGKAGHAGHSTGDNAIYKAIDDITWFKQYSFPKESSALGKVNMQVTQIESGKQHNIIPDLCAFVVDVRLTDAYSHEEILRTINENIHGTATARSTRLKPSGISHDHWIVKKAESLGVPIYGSSTLSDQALMPFSTVKIGPGDTHRSHTRDEYILISEIKQGIEVYLELLL